MPEKETLVAGSEPLKLRGIDHVLVLVTDLEAALRFYERVEADRTSFSIRDPSANTIELRSAPMTRRA